MGSREADRYLFGIRPNEKISKLFPLSDKKVIASQGQCIVGIVGTGRTDTRERKDKLGIRP